MLECGTNVGNSKCPMPRRLPVYWMRSKVISGGHSLGALPGLAAACLKGLISLGSGTISFSSGHWEMSTSLMTPFTPAAPPKEPLSRCGADVLYGSTITTGGRSMGRSKTGQGMARDCLGW